MIDPKVLREIVERIRKSAANYTYFFDRLDSAEWIGPLRERGFLSRPPEPERQGNMISFPAWPESRYLARVAEQASELVLETILALPQTENYRVHEDLVDAAIKMRGSLSAKFAAKEARWIEGQRSMPALLPEKIGLLVAHLAKGGEVKAALRLAGSLLRPIPDPRAAQKLDREADKVSLSPEPVARFDLWEYEQILKKYVPELIRAARLEGLRLLCDLLDLAIGLSGLRNGGDRPHDVSCVWRPAVEEHGQNRVNWLIKPMLVSVLRDGAEVVIREGLAGLADVVAVLEDRKRRWPIFGRIVMHLLRVFPDAPVAIIARYLTDSRLFDEGDSLHEYSLLLERWFKSLDGRSQRRILRRIEKGPQWAKEGKDQDVLKANYRAMLGRDLSDEEIGRRGRMWQRDWLARLGKSLPDELAERYQRLVQEFGEPSHPLFSSYSEGVVTGWRSPKEKQDLGQMRLDEMVSYLQTWQPSREFMGESRAGLGQTLQALVTEDPARFATSALHFRGVHPTYIRLLIHGLREAIGKKKAFAWEPVVELCKWVLEQRDEDVPKGTPYWLDEDQDWSWTRGAIANLLDTALSQDPAIVPFELRRDLWSLLATLASDPNPDPTHEARYGANNMDPSNLSINTTRGVALHAVMRYAFWIRNYYRKQPGELARVSVSFDEMPEVREVLGKHLDIDNEPSLAIRSVYGRWFRWIYVIDPAWASVKASSIFPDSEHLRPYWEAAWSAYLAFSDARDDVFDALKSQYCLAVGRLGMPRSLPKVPGNPETELGAHLMAFYWRGKLDLDNALLNEFFARAGDEVRSNALETMGRWLCQLKESDQLPSEDVRRKLMTLWESRLQSAQDNPVRGGHVREMAAFGWWFRSDFFPAAWAVTQLDRALEIALRGNENVIGVIAHTTLEPLAAIFEQHPTLVLGSLVRLAKAGASPWHLMAGREQVRSILTRALKTGPQTRETAVELIHYLGSRGIRDYADLLKTG